MVKFLHSKFKMKEMFDVFKNHNDDFLLNENVMDFPDKDYSD